jgi:exodeoxyribonuclease VII large subunit
MQNQRIFSVSELNASIRGILETQYSFIAVTGQISNLRRPHSGHLYFTLKDNLAQIKGVLFKMQQRYLSQQPKEGQQVICRGRLSVYEPRGDYQLIIDTMEFQGTGALQIAFEQLKQKLAAEGLFAESKKKCPPAIPEHITLVTSPGGAAVHDFIRVAHKRFPQTALTVYPVAVQGGNAAAEICQAIEEINRLADTDVIVLCRGGGSIEDLWCFNEEKVARAIYASQIVIVSAIGHEIDYTIADFTADVRAPTPSAAAEILLPDKESLKAQLQQTSKRLALLINSMLNTHAAHLSLYKKILGDMYHPLENLFLQLDHNNTKLEQAMMQKIAEKQHHLDRLANRLQQKNPAKELALKQQQWSILRQRLLLAGTSITETRYKKLAGLASILDAVSPLATLARGYSITRQQKTNRIITSYKDAPPESLVEVILHDGRLACVVKKAEK